MSEEGLYSLAEIAITLAGFTGLLGFFRSSTSSVKGEMLRIFYIFIMCFATIVGAFLPPAISTFLPDSDAGWYVSTVYVGLVALAISVWAIVQFLTGRVGLSLPIPSYSMAIFSGLVGVTLLGASFGIVSGPVKGFLIIGLLWFLLYSGYIFVTTLFWGTGDEKGI